MISHEQNDALTKTGPGTHHGRAFPALLDTRAAREELPEPDCPPVRVQAARASASSRSATRRGASG